MTPHPGIQPWTGSRVFSSPHLPNASGNALSVSTEIQSRLAGAWRGTSSPVTEGQAARSKGPAAHRHRRGAGRARPPVARRWTSPEDLALLPRRPGGGRVAVGFGVQAWTVARTGPSGGPPGAAPETPERASLLTPPRGRPGMGRHPRGGCVGGCRLPPTRCALHLGATGSHRGLLFSFFAVHWPVWFRHRFRPLSIFSAPAWLH